MDGSHTVHSPTNTTKRPAYTLQYVRRLNGIFVLKDNVIQITVSVGTRESLILVMKRLDLPKTVQNELLGQLENLNRATPKD